MGVYARRRPFRRWRIMRAFRSLQCVVQRYSASTFNDGRSGLACVGLGGSAGAACAGVDGFLCVPGLPCASKLSAGHSRHCRCVYLRCLSRCVTFRVSTFDVPLCGNIDVGSTRLSDGNFLPARNVRTEQNIRTAVTNGKRYDFETSEEYRTESGTTCACCTGPLTTGPVRPGIILQA